MKMQLYPGLSSIGAIQGQYTHTIRSLLFAMLLLLPNQHNSHESHSLDTDTVQLSNDNVTSGRESSPVLDTVPASHQSLLYYHIARGSDGVFNVREKAMRVTALSDRIHRTAQGVMPDDIIELFRGLIFTESGGDPHATSTAGAKGVAQLLKSTAAQYGGYSIVNGTVQDKRTDVQWSLQTAVKILHGHYKSFGDWSLAFAAYHMGHGNMTKLRAIYQQTMGKPLVSIDQLYQEIPSQAVINRFAGKKDDTFGYLAKIHNAVTLLRLYEQDRPYFDQLVDTYSQLPYDVRGIVAENILFGVDDYLCSLDDIVDAIGKEELVTLDHSNFVCGSHDFANHLHAAAAAILDTLTELYGSTLLVTCGLLDDGSIGGRQTHVQGQQTLRLGSHTTGKAFDIQAPSNRFVGKELVGSDDFYRMEYILTLLRYQGKIIWCREVDTQRKKVEHFHIVVL